MCILFLIESRHQHGFYKATNQNTSSILILYVHMLDKKNTTLSRQVRMQNATPHTNSYNRTAKFLDPTVAFRFHLSRFWVQVGSQVGAKLAPKSEKIVIRKNSARNVCGKSKRKKMTVPSDITYQAGAAMCQTCV